jgi:hypothetical protein
VITYNASLLAMTPSRARINEADARLLQPTEKFTEADRRSIASHATWLAYRSTLCRVAAILD